MSVLRRGGTQEILIAVIDGFNHFFDTIQAGFPETLE